MWDEYHRDECLDAWETSDHPSHEQRVAVYLRLMELREDPRPDSSRIIGDDVGFGEGRLADVPDTNVVVIYYIVRDDLHAISYALIDTL